MQISLNATAIILGILGAFSLLVGSLYQEVSGGDMTKPWHKRYWWYVWKPWYINTKTLEWKLKWNRVIIQDGFMPLKTKFEVLGFILILIASLFQLLD
jgi:hypothetical protein